TAKTGLQGRTAVVRALDVLSSEYSDGGFRVIREVHGGWRHGYVSAAAPGNRDGEGGVKCAITQHHANQIWVLVVFKAPFSTAGGDGEDYLGLRRFGWGLDREWRRRGFGGWDRVSRRKLGFLLIASEGSVCGLDFEYIQEGYGQNNWEKNPPVRAM
ncbi:hypothetical protein PIB30_071485, partial [Stylosanthes scabra]|nr:hypothetical protein [Stylosanthes scabra]